MPESKDKVTQEKSSRVAFSPSNLPPRPHGMIIGVAAAFCHFIHSPCPVTNFSPISTEPCRLRCAFPFSASRPLLIASTAAYRSLSSFIFLFASHLPLVSAANTGTQFCIRHLELVVVSCSPTPSSVPVLTVIRPLIVCIHSFHGGLCRVSDYSATISHLASPPHGIVSLVAPSA
ncbi:hypothetical protein N656DRAFT_581828 [Canariomyces notabilis]|uniref:Uncharacterized protein n=1 Tax=Canariomyces notabilis TaxID=2074819 RepID=A0AAN6TGY0_9PEZI|nr:hypothetical protein N656DRAFT_581828 [Canariomyces arenarius]